MYLLKNLFATSLACIVFFMLGIGYGFGDSSSSDDSTSSNDRKQLPLWELDVAAIAARLPHYMGSDEYESYHYILPYLIYRGDVLRADRQGVRGILFESKRFETSLSAWGNPPVPEDNDAREGMPELDAVGELGPALRYYIYERGWLDHLYLQVAVRGTISFDFNGGLDIGMAYEGWHGSLDLNYQNKSLFKDHDLSLYFKASLHFADSLYNDYFYGVESQYATAERERYDADAGYGGFSLSSSLYKRLTSRLSVGCYARWNNLNGAVFEDSPLVRDKNNYSFGSMLVWRAAESSEPAWGTR